MAPTQSLPPELFRPIAEGLNNDLPTVRALLTVSRAFSAEAERIAFRAMGMRLRANDDPSIRSIRMLQSVPTCPRHAHLLQKLSIRYLHDLDVQRRDAPNRALLVAVLHAAVNLKELTLVIRDFRVNDLVGCAFRLRMFQHDHLYIGSSTSPYTVENTGAFLAKQAELESLDLTTMWHYTEGDVPLLPVALPHLTTFSGDTMALYTILPGRRVTNLRWVFRFEDENIEPVPEEVVESLQHVRSLCVRFCLSRPSPFFALLALLQNLQYLDLGQDQPLDIEHLSRISHLRGLSISATANSISTPGEAVARAEECFVAAPGLQFVEVEVPWPGREQVWRWERESAPAFRKHFFRHDWRAVDE